MGIIAQDRAPVGNSGLHVSRLGVGGGSLTNASGEAGVAELLQACWNSGLRYFDTAPLYNGGESERRFGAFLRGCPRRDDVVLSTKVGRYPDKNGERVFDYSERAARSSIEESLARSGLDRLDMVIVHDIDTAMHEDFECRFSEVIAETLPVLEDYRAKGVIRAIGISSRQPSVCIRAVEQSRIDCIMMAGAYTLLQHEPLDSLFPLCLERSVAILMASPYNTGILATGSRDAPFEYRPASTDILNRVAGINAICARYGLPIATAALQFPLYHPAVVSVVVGQRSVAELQSNLAALDTPIPDAFWADMKDGGFLPTSAPTGFSRARREPGTAKI